MAVIQGTGNFTPGLYGKAGLRTRGRPDGRDGPRCHVRGLPMDEPQWPCVAHIPAYRCGGSTGFAAVESRRTPVSRFIRLPGSAGGHLAAAAGPTPGCPNYIGQLSGVRSKVMKDLHKRPLLLDAAENLPL